VSNHPRRRRVLSPEQTAVAGMLGPLDGSRIPGGCDHCDSYQTVGPRAAGVWELLVHHDSDCPAYGTMKQGQA